MSHGIEYVPVADARRRLAPAHGDSWDEATAGLLSGRHSAATVSALVDEYRRSGGFETPVLWVSDDEDGVDRVLDGMHRMVAASLVSGVVGLHEGWLTDHPAPDTVHVVFELDLPHAVGQDAMEVAFDLLRSFGLRGGPWVTADVMSGQHSTFEAIWYCPAAHTGGLVRELIDRVRREGGCLRPMAVNVELAESQHPWPAAGSTTMRPSGEVVADRALAAHQVYTIILNPCNVSPWTVACYVRKQQMAPMVGGSACSARRLCWGWCRGPCTG